MHLRDLNKGGAIGPPHFGRLEGAAGRAALLLAPQFEEAIKVPDVHTSFQKQAVDFRLQSETIYFPLILHSIYVKK